VQVGGESGVVGVGVVILCVVVVVGLGVGVWWVVEVEVWFKMKVRDGGGCEMFDGNSDCERRGMLVTANVCLLCHRVSGAKGSVVGHGVALSTVAS
jgi:hypothetical protein